MPPTSIPHVALCALLPALCSCGTIGRDDSLEERPCNATGPWTDRGSVEVCLGTALAVPTSARATDVGGLCVEEEARRCDDDAGCSTGERCRCGLCRVLRCRSSSECLADESCIVALGRCARPCDPAVTDACPSGFGCSLGGCVALCGGDADCAHGASCSIRSGRCVVAPCTGDGDCGTGRRCEVQTVAADILGPAAFVEEDDALVWAEVARDGRSAIHRFAWPSPARLVAVPETPLLEPLATWEEGRVGAPSMLATDGTIWLLYAGGADAGIGLATADAAGSFIRVSDGPILAPAATWEGGRVGTPAAAVDGEGNVLLLYTGGGGTGIGAARRTSDGSFERLSPAPLLVPGVLEAPGRWTELDRLADPSFSRTGPDSPARLYVAARGVLSAGDEPRPGATPDWSIGVLLIEMNSINSLSWTADPFGPALARRSGVGDRSELDERSPAVVRTATDWRMLYERRDADGTVRLRSASCP